MRGSCGCSCGSEDGGKLDGVICGLGSEVDLLPEKCMMSALACIELEYEHVFVRGYGVSEHRDNGREKHHRMV